MKKIFLPMNFIPIFISAQELVIQHPIDTANLDASSTLQETHLIQTESLKDVLRTEEHFSSEVKSFVVLSPPKFKQVKIWHKH
jgi:hypothetical protein